jgi:hypothetical protein
VGTAKIRNKYPLREFVRNITALASVTGYITFKYVYGMAFNYYHKTEKSEHIHVHAPAIPHPGRQFLHSFSKRLCGTHRWCGRVANKAVCSNICMTYEFDLSPVISSVLSDCADCLL